MSAVQRAILDRPAQRVRADAGVIRPGIQVLTKKFAADDKAREIYQSGIQAGKSFDAIGNEIAKALDTKARALVPKNTPFFVARKYDFHPPVIAERIMDKYATVNEELSQHKRLYRLPVQFVFDDWLMNMPHELAVWSRSGRKFWSQYEADGERHCKTFARVTLDQKAKRDPRFFGGRPVVDRADSPICKPEECPEYQNGECKLNGSLLVYVPDVGCSGLIRVLSTSFYGMDQWREKMELVSNITGGRIARLDGVFAVSKVQQEVSRLVAGDDGEVRSQKTMQWLTYLELDMSLEEIADRYGAKTPALGGPGEAAALLEGPRNGNGGAHDDGVIEGESVTEDAPAAKEQFDDDIPF